MTQISLIPRHAHYFLIIDAAGNHPERTIGPLNQNLYDLHPAARTRITLESDQITTGHDLNSILKMSGMEPHAKNVLQFIVKDGRGYPSRLSGPIPDSLIYHIDLDIELPGEIRSETQGALIYDKTKF